MKPNRVLGRRTFAFGAMLFAALIMLAGGDATAAGDPYAAILKYDVGQSRQPLAAIKDEIRNATAEQLLEIEAKLLGALKAPEATFACRQFVCRMLRRVGTVESLPALGALLADEKLSHMARFALQEMQDPRVDDLLRNAMDSVSGNARVGVVNTIARREDPKAVPQLAKLIENEDRALVRAALSALGHIGGGKAAKALADAEVAGDLVAVRDDAYLMCAEKMLAEGQWADAASIYNRMINKKYPTVVRVAAYRGLILADKAQAVPTVLALLQDEEPELQESAAKLAREIPGSAATKAFAASLPVLSPSAQVALLSALAGRGDKAALPEVAKAAGSTDEAVRSEAIRALGVLGGVSSVETLILAMAEGGAIGDASAEALSRLRGSGIGETLVKAVESGSDPAIRVSLIKVLEIRGEKAVVPILLKTVEDSNSKVRKASYKALGKLAGEGALPALVDLLVSSEASSARRSLERTLTAVLGRIPEVDTGTPHVIAGLAKAGAKAKANLVAVLGNAGGSKALEALREELKSGDDAEKTAAVRALGKWSDATPAADLLAVAKDDSNGARQVLAFRGYVGLIGLASARPAEETLRMYKAAMAIAGQPDAKKRVLSGVSSVPNRDALEFVKKYLEDEEIKAEAESAYRKISDLLEESGAT